MAVRGSPRKSSGAGGAVARLIAAGSVAGAPGGALGRVGVIPWSVVGAAAHALGGGVRARLRTGIGIAATAFGVRGVRVRVLLLGGPTRMVRCVVHHVVPRHLRKRRQRRVESARPGFTGLLI